jgi:sorbitol-specific phosphotransferase system component IIBC
LDVRSSEMDGISFFKDKTELIRIQKGQSKMEEMSKYFEQQKMHEYPKRSLLEKVGTKLGQSVTHLYNLARLRIVTLSKFNFYYR